KQRRIKNVITGEVEYLSLDVCLQIHRHLRVSPTQGTARVLDELPRLRHIAIEANIGGFELFIQLALSVTLMSFSNLLVKKVARCKHVRASDCIVLWVEGLMLCCGRRILPGGHNRCSHYVWLNVLKDPLRNFISPFHFRDHLRGSFPHPVCLATLSRLDFSPPRRDCGEGSDKD